MERGRQRQAPDQPGAGAHLPKVAELVAAQLRWRIIAGSPGDGAELPRESDMIEEFRVSRPTA